MTIITQPTIAESLFITKSIVSNIHTKYERSSIEHTHNTKRFIRFDGISAAAFLKFPQIYYTSFNTIRPGPSQAAHTRTNKQYT